MAKCQIEGLDELIDDMARLWDQAEEVFEEMLDLGAEEVKEAWKETAEKHGHKETGEMIKAIDYTKRPGSPGGLKVAHIYPQGKDNRGIRLAAKAFWRHYGTRQKPGTYWVDTADENAANRVPTVLWERWRRYLKGQ